MKFYFFIFISLYLSYINTYTRIIYFFVNYTVTTEIYTYLHTLSLNDALPISQVRDGQRAVAAVQLAAAAGIAFGTHETGQHAGPVQAVGALRGPVVVRSEEHTSELQSLMRISYAVFCLKKNNKYTNIILTQNIVMTLISHMLHVQHIR